VAAGGISIENMKWYWDARVNGFGFGSNVYRLGTKPQKVKEKAMSLVSQCRSLIATQSRLLEVSQRFNVWSVGNSSRVQTNIVAFPFFLYVENNMGLNCNIPESKQAGS